MRGGYKWQILAGHWTIKLGIQMAGRNKIFESLFFCLIVQCTWWLMYKSSILSAKFDRPVAHQNLSLLQAILHMIVKLA